MNRSLMIALAFMCGMAAVGDSAAKKAEAASGNIVEVAVNAGTFNTLAKALGEAGLVETLQGKGPFTVFAPTDEAFAKLPEGTLESLLLDKEKLKGILLYHVLPGRVTSAQVVKLDSAKSAQGTMIRVQNQKGVVRVNQARVIQTDIQASNGIIHVIDEVILP